MSRPAGVRLIAGAMSLALAWPVGAQDAASAPASAHEGPPAWTLATLPDEPVPFHGLANMDRAGLDSGSMLYPTGGLGVLGLVVGVATHAALVGGVRASQENRMQAAADKVLDPYRGALAQFHLRELEQRALAATSSAAVAHLRDAKEAPAGDVLVEASPVFAMTPDSTALVLDETVVVHPSASSGQGVQQVLRVISAPRAEPDLPAAWGADDAAELKTTAAALMAQSLDIALRLTHPPVDDKQAFRTLRYRFGDRERMERGQLLEETCERQVIRTLRGALLVVPHTAGAALPAGCPPAPVPAAAASAVAAEPAASSAGA